MTELEHPRPRGRPPWRLVPWYQASYNYAANLLHLALDPEPRAHSNLAAPSPDALVSEATAEATALLRHTVETLRSPTYWRWRVRHPGSEGRALGVFLRRTVEPAVAVLLAGLLVEQRKPFRDAERRSLTRRRLQKALQSSDLPSPRELVEYAKAARPEPRVHYNIACLYSSVGQLVVASQLRRDTPTWLSAMSHAERERLKDSVLRQSLDELAVYFRLALDVDERTLIADWARTDPSLAAVRTDPETRREFELLIHRNMRLPAPLDTSDKQPPPLASTAT